MAKSSKRVNLNKMKDQLSSAKTSKMRVVQKYLCDDCNTLIQDPEDGYVIQGNVYVADPSCRGGIIGNAFPDPDEDGKVAVDDVTETVLCAKCLMKALKCSGSLNEKYKKACGKPQLNSDVSNKIHEALGKKKVVSKSFDETSDPFNF